MIEEVAGHLRSVRTDEELLEILKADLKSMSDEEREALAKILADLKEPPPEGKTLYARYAEAEWLRTPVDMETFILDPYYLGATCEGFYPRVLADMKHLFSGGYQECVWTGAIGAGKTFASSVVVSRIIYEISCMRDPHRSFGLAPGSNMSIVCFSVTEELATKVVFENISSKIQASPYFRDHFRFKPNKSELLFPRNFWVAARASTDNSALGLNVIAAWLDEAAFLPELSKAARVRLGTKALGRAESIYNILRRRMKSRFMRRGRLPGMLVIASSKQTDDDFVMRRIKVAKKDPTIFVSDRSLWDVRPEEYSKKTFPVLVGDDINPSRVLTDEEAAGLRASPEAYTILDVPEDFRKDFETDVESSIRDLAGVSTVTVAPYITRRDKIRSAVDPNRSHPFPKVAWCTAEPLEIQWDRLILPHPTQHNAFIPRFNPSAQRFFHIDPSKGAVDPTGFAMGHIAGWRKVRRRLKTGEEIEERAPLILFDVLLRILPPVGGEIEFSRVRELVYELEGHGFKIGRSSMDQWNSVDSLQQFRARGWTAEVFSVDRTIEPYYRLRLGLYEDRISYYAYEPLQHELRKVEFDPKTKKVDHPSGETKDVADAAAAVVAQLEAYPPMEAPPVLFSRSDVALDPNLSPGDYGVGSDWTDLHR